MPAPEIPTASRSSGNQQQLDAMIAETTVPILAIVSPRPEGASEVESAGLGRVDAPAPSGSGFAFISVAFYSSGFCLESLFLDRAQKFCGINFLRIIRNVQQVFVQIGLNSSNSGKPFQGLCDLVRSIQSQKLELFCHAANIIGNRFFARRGRRFGG
jgi:hypothetical protein